MKKVLIITYYWPPSGGAGVQRWLKFVKYFREFGLDPVVLTVNPEQASYAVMDASLEQEIPPGTEVVTTKTMEPFGLYKRFVGTKEIPFGGFANESDPGMLQKVSRFIRGNLFIPDARVGWNRFAYRKACELIKTHDIGTVITTSPPHSTQLIGQKLKRKLGLKWVADMRDPWTEIYYYDRLYHGWIARKIDARFERNTLLLADHIIVVSEAIKASFAQKTTQLVAPKIRVIPNGFDPADFPKKDQPSTSELIITYTGTIADNYGVETFLKTLSEFNKQSEDARISLRFVGKASEGVKEWVEQYALTESVSFISHVSHKESIDYLLNSSALLLVIPKVVNNEGILTGKLFEYLAARKSIIGLGPVHGDAAKIIADCEAGKMIDYDDADAMMAYISSLHASWHDAGNLNLSSEAFLQYSRKNLTRQLTRLI